MKKKEIDIDEKYLCMDNDHRFDIRYRADGLESVKGKTCFCGLKKYVKPKRIRGPRRINSNYSALG